ncbi:DUF5011 domain-containing protein [Candidatus Saccharibacteria bacterium]|nr:DUF5011 domain-containing protein [Candidatus Saccharibacteria bacterium]
MEDCHKGEPFPPAAPLKLSNREIRELHRKVRHHISSRKRSHKAVLILSLSLFFLILGVGGFYAYAISKASVSFRLLGSTEEFLTTEESFADKGFLASYCVLGHCQDISSEVVIENPSASAISSRLPGEYTITYRLNYAERTFSETRKLVILDVLAPELVLNGEQAIGLYVGDIWLDPGFTATDNVDDSLTSSVAVSGSVDTSRSGVYLISYSVSDSSDNSVTQNRIVQVFERRYTFSPTPTASFADLEAYIEAHGWDLSFGYKNFEQNFVYARGYERVYYGASLVKTLDALYAYERGVLDWYTKSLLSQAVSNSNNSAHATLVSRLGLSNLQAYAESLGMKYHLKGSTIFTGAGVFCDTTVEDQLLEWDHLWVLINTLENGQELKNYFLRGAYASSNFAGNPPMLFKAGFYGGTIHESSIFLADSPYFLTILSNEGWRREREDILHDISHRVYMLNTLLTSGAIK